MLATALYPSYLNPGDNAWQMTAATLVGLMSVPGRVVLYGGVMQKRWSVNSMMLTFVAFAVIGSLAFVREYRVWMAGPSGPGRALLALAFTLLFAYFGVTSFWRVRRRRS